MLLSKITVIILFIITTIGFFLGLWKIFEKAGEKGWKAIVPVYNMWVWIKVLSRPKWWMILVCLPFITIFMYYMMVWKTIRLFGKTSYLPLIFGTLFNFVYFPYLGFSSKEKFTRLEDLPKFKKSPLREWGDALIFAVAAAYIIRTFIVEFYTIPTSSMESSLMVGDFLAVGKMRYGGRVPQTILAVPFVHHTVPGTKSVKSYLEWITLPYMRFPVLAEIKKGDVVVFNYPDGDTVATERQNESYYDIVREYRAALNYNNVEKHERDFVDRRYNALNRAKLQQHHQGAYYPGKEHDAIRKDYKVVARPVDKRENYVKRCVAIPGDRLKIVESQVYINGTPLDNPKNMQYSYYAYAPENIVGASEFSRKGRDKEVKLLNSLDVNLDDYTQLSGNLSVMFLTEKQKKALESKGYELSKIEDDPGKFEYSIFPHDPRYKWNRDNFGEIVIPKKGETVEINDSTIVLYDRIIKNYEQNDLKVENGTIYINGEKATHYTFQQNYYFMMGDNRHNSADSRFWGFVPEDHVVGKAQFVWLSLDKHKNLSEGKVRFNRMFKFIK
ncbi:signal peptidase I [Bacteroidales bacterium OttesenSCG-928-B11]|nr:signal peptidase I [Bacteroidales bacterium OttesenSCG-928-E04]MDL2309083.1 signal peptidase I [Bacteroidales bacterium OttesenSCG-928-C03]MDL2312192.1 signal peptidase I [Bacteroidales bacterium OttesenSCG-928-B11]MDL2326240.1 signal peptidase I [Bacteroidales bacterium OttesenSCG-928-A14]